MPCIKNKFVFFNLNSLGDLSLALHLSSSFYDKGISYFSSLRIRILLFFCLVCSSCYTTMFSGKEEERKKKFNTVIYFLLQLEYIHILYLLTSLHFFLVSPRFRCCLVRIKVRMYFFFCIAGIDV